MTETSYRALRWPDTEFRQKIPQRYPWNKILDPRKIPTPPKKTEKIPNMVLFRSGPPEKETKTKIQKKKQTWYSWVSWGNFGSGGIFFCEFYVKIPGRASRGSVAGRGILNHDNLPCRLCTLTQRTSVDCARHIWRRGNTIRGNRTESLREENLPLRGSSRGPPRGTLVMKIKSQNGLSEVFGDFRTETVHVFGTSHSHKAFPRPLRPTLMYLKGGRKETLYIGTESGTGAGCVSFAVLLFLGGGDGMRLRMCTEQWCSQQAEEMLKNVALGNLQKCVGGFLLYKFWRIFPGIFLEDFSGHFFPTKIEEKKSDEKIREKIRRLKNKNPRKIRSAESRP